MRIDAASSADATAAPASAFTVIFDLEGTPQGGTLALSTPLGGTVAQARWQGDAAEWTDDRGRRHGGQVSELTAQALGTPLPLAALMDWLDGRPSSEAASEPLAPPAVGFRQFGWTVDLARRPQGALTATREQPSPATIRIRLDAPAAR